MLWSRVAITTKFDLNFQKVLDEYQAHGNEFLLKVFESSKYLEEVTGIDEMENMDNDVSLQPLYFIWLWDDFTFRLLIMMIWSSTLTFP